MLTKYRHNRRIKKKKKLLSKLEANSKPYTQKDLDRDNAKYYMTGKYAPSKASNKYTIASINKNKEGRKKVLEERLNKLNRKSRATN